MIPIRIKVQGFMSYRDPAEFHFEGSKLWMLSGPNGAGKSTVFDAITWVLYGVHRGGRQNAKELINQGAQSLLVEFDFRIGPDDYRVKRTLSRSGNPSFQAWHLRGPAVPSGKGVAGEARAIPGSDYRDGFDAWVLQTVGLDDLTFTASVMLQQGKSDALLEANPAKRHEMLSQIVGLEAYEKLHAKADGERKSFEGAAKTLNAQLAGLEIVDDTQIATEAERAKEWETTAQKAHAAHLELAQLRVRAERWQELRDEQHAIEIALRDAQDLFTNAARIETDANRLRDLAATLPRLRDVLNEQVNLRASEASIARKNAALQAAQDELSAVQKSLAVAQEKQGELQARQLEAQARSQEAGQRELELGRHLPALDDLANARREIENLDAQLQRFAEDLDTQIESAQQTATRGQEIKNALPWLRQFAAARASFGALKAEAKSADAELQAKRGEYATAKARHDELEAREPQEREAAQSAQDSVTQSATLRDEIRKRVERFKSVENLPECEYCGQPLTPQHVGSEKTRIREEYTQANAALQEAQALREGTQQAHLQTSAELKELSRLLRGLDEEIYRIDCNVSKAREQGALDKTRCEEAFAALPPLYQSKIDPSGLGKFAQLSTSLFPDDDDLREAARLAQDAAAALSQLQTLQNQKAERDDLRARRAPFESVRRARESEYPPQRESEIRTAHTQAGQAAREAMRELKELEAPLQNAAREAENAARAIDAARDRQQQSATELAQESVRREGIERAAQTALSNVPIVWQSLATALDEVQLRAWQSEADSLHGAEEKWTLLQTAQRDNAGQLKRLHQVENELDDIPVAARRALHEVESEEAQAKAGHESAVREQRRHENEKQRLESLKQRRLDTEKTARRMEKQAQLYKILADYLGRDRLQRFLLQQAETGIVSNANQVLDRISGGTLRLELRHDGNEASSKAVRALDLLAYNSEAGEDPMPVYLLSGSQRFRVAVSLALGIGQFAGSGTRRIESVIIDEGFGSLDQEGRREIIEELHMLKEELSRVILVSHQDEFADAFPNRYTIELKNNTSVVTLMDEK